MLLEPLILRKSEKPRHGVLVQFLHLLYTPLLKGDTETLKDF